MSKPKHNSNWEVIDSIMLFSTCDSYSLEPGSSPLREEGEESGSRLQYIKINIIILWEDGSHNIVVLIRRRGHTSIIA